MRRATRFAAVTLLAAASLSCAATVSESDAAGARIHHDIAVASLDRGELREALRELLLAVRLDPELAQAHYALGLVYHAMGRSEDARAHYERAIALKPAFSEAHNNLGVLLIDLARPDEAVPHFQKALSDILYATPSLAEGNMGWAYFKQGDVTAARRHLRNAVAQNPKFCRGYEWLARIGLEAREPAETVAAVKRFEKHCASDTGIAAKLAPDYLRQMRYYLGRGYVELGDRESARRTFAVCAVTEAEGEFGPKCTQSLRALD